MNATIEVIVIVGTLLLFLYESTYFIFLFKIYNSFIILRAPILMKGVLLPQRNNGGFKVSHIRVFFCLNHLFKFLCIRIIIFKKCVTFQLNIILCFTIKVYNIIMHTKIIHNIIMCTFIDLQLSVSRYDNIQILIK